MKGVRQNVMRVYACITAYIAAEQLFGQFLPSTLVRIFELLCLGCMIWFTVRVFAAHRNFQYRGWPLMLIILLALCNLFIIARGHYTGGLKDMILLKFSYSQIPAYILPFVVLFLPNRKYIRSILEVFFYSMLLIVPIWLINSLNLVQEQFYGESLGVYLPFFGTLLILFRRHLSQRQKVIVIVLYFVYFVLMVLNARRNMVVSLSLYFVIALLMGNYTLFKRSARARLWLIGGVAAVALILVASWGILSKTVFDRLLFRGMEDTRSEVELFFIVDMASSPAVDWIAGRGIDGFYAQITQNSETMEVSASRNVIETGYLYLILKGGLVYLILILLFLFTAFFRGIRFKKPLLRGMCLFLLIYLVDLYMTNQICFFTVRTVVLWVIVSVCLQYRKNASTR